jgi:hypothetical protein
VLLQVEIMIRASRWDAKNSLHATESTLSTKSPPFLFNRNPFCCRQLGVIYSAQNQLSIAFCRLVQTGPFVDEVHNSLASREPKLLYSPRSEERCHNMLRECTRIRREYLIPESAGSSDTPGTEAASSFVPSPAGQMCKTMAFGYSLFYKNRFLRPDLLATAAKQLATELPPLAGRVRPVSGIPGLRPMGSVVIDNVNEGIEYNLAETREHSIDDLGPHTWVSGLHNQRLADFGVPFHAEPVDIRRMLAGKDALFKLKLTRCLDGHIVSVTVSHLLADAGRAVRLLERLGKLYRCAASGGDPGPPLQLNPSLETPRGLAEALVEPPTEWKPLEPDHNLSAKQWMMAPQVVRGHVSQKYDAHLIYLPKPTMQRLKAIAAEGIPKLPDSWTQGSHVTGQQHLSTMDAIQAFLATLVADLRGKPLVPTAPQELTVNVDLLHKGSNWKDPDAIARHIGNAVHILHVPGVDKETAVPSALHDCDDASIALAKLRQAIAMNAGLIRRSIAAFRSNPSGPLQALERQERLVKLSEGQVAAAFVVKGADMKVASSTAVTAFPFDNVSDAMSADLS